MNRCAFDVRDSRLVQNLFHHNKIGVIFTKFGDSMSDVNLWVFDCAMESTLVKCRNKTFEMFEMFNLCEGNEVIFWWGGGRNFSENVVHMLGSWKHSQPFLLFSCHSLYCSVWNYFFIGTSMDQWCEWVERESVPGMEGILYGRRQVAAAVVVSAMTTTMSLMLT